MLISHVKDGLDIATQTNLPKALRPFIREHHGTTIQKYFYEKAKALGEDVKEEDFRYPGPRPQTRETALVMLADSVEAAIKARNKPFESDDELSAFIRQVIQSKVDAGQMNDADFTLREIANIEEAFLNVFRSTYHSREVKDINEIIKEARRKRGGSEPATEDEKNENDDTLR